jgi:hypothetical protein
MKRWLQIFRDAWHEADDRNLPGSRSEYAMNRAMPPALLAYSEWLDGEGLLLGDEDREVERTHEELVNEFLSERSA